MKYLALVVVTVIAAPARADRADDLVTDGEALAQHGDFHGAIAKFRAAELVRPAPLHACLIGLAHARLGALGDAALELDDCRQRAVPLPPWFDAEYSALVAQLGVLGTIDLAIDPTVKLVAIDALADGRAIVPPPRVHVPPGHHVLVGRAADGREVRAELEIAAGETRTVALALERPARSRAPLYVLIGGGVLAVAGGIMHVAVVRPAYDRFSQATPATYDQVYSDYSTKRYVTIGLYAAAAVAIGTGIVLRAREPGEPQLGAALVPGGATLTLGWVR